ncbi:hypothetical protein K488DRAFT_87217 [Vararia minispora EC-137]|uniref:Uncharacterized protein n=1 Tax=Vararia minispora EC-137 TaxID=1314806 RepID=A0ACB8QH75_9AGAM|nr:hypothetical protein K488DRAFT_87217 [Vararia minispora EC-137]
MPGIGHITPPRAHLYLPPEHSPLPPPHVIVPSMTHLPAPIETPPPMIRIPTVPFDISTTPILEAPPKPVDDVSASAGIQEVAVGGAKNDEDFPCVLVYPDSSDDMEMDSLVPVENTTLLDSETPLDHMPHPLADRREAEEPPSKDSCASEFSDLTALSDDSAGSEDSSDDEPLSKRPKRSGLKIRIRIPPGFSFDKIRADTAMVEPGSRWKLCDSCRLKYRKYQRKRLGVTNPRTDVEQTSRGALETPELSCHGTLDVNESRECSSARCRNRIPLEDAYRWKRCLRCRVRGRWNVKRQRVISLHYETGEAHVGIAQHILHEHQRQRNRRQKLGLDPEFPMPPGMPYTPFVPDNTVKLESADNVERASVKVYPVYQHLDECLTALRTYVENFIHAQTLYVREMLDWGASEKTAASFGFAFNGEFSIVAGWDIKSDNTAGLVMDIWKGIESRLGVQLSQPTQPWFEDQAMITRMACKHEFALNIPPSSLAPAPGGCLASQSGTQLGMECQVGVSLSVHPDRALIQESKVQDDATLRLTSPASVRLEHSWNEVPGSLPVTSDDKPILGNVGNDESLEEGPSAISLTAIPMSEDAVSIRPSIPSSHSTSSKPATPVPIDLATPLVGSSDSSDSTDITTPTLVCTAEESECSNLSPPSVDSLPLSPDGAIFARTMRAEVEIRVSEDDRNKFLPGHRIVALSSSKDIVMILDSEEGDGTALSFFFSGTGFWSSRTLLIALPLVLGLIFISLLFIYWCTRTKTPRIPDNPIPFFARRSSMPKGGVAQRSTPSLPMRGLPSRMEDTFSDAPFLDMKDDSYGGTMSSSEFGYQLRQDALRAFQYLDNLPPPTPPPKNAPLPPVPTNSGQFLRSFPLPRSQTSSTRRVSSWSRIRPDLQSLKTKTSFGAISFARSTSVASSDSNLQSKQPFWASIPPLLLSPTSSSSPTRIRPLPPLPNSPATPTAPPSALRPLLPNRLGEVILHPDRIDHEPAARLARALDAEADLSPPPYYWHRVLV